jgi:hypothetical protein
MSLFLSAILIPTLGAGAVFAEPKFPLAPHENFSERNVRIQPVIEANSTGARRQRKKGKWGGRKLRRAKI